MRMLGLLIVVLVRLLPAPAHAQSPSIKLEDLLGTWTSDTKAGSSITFLPDSTFIFHYTEDRKVGPKRWNYLKGDVISLSPETAGCKPDRAGQYGPCGEPGYKITLGDSWNYLGDKITFRGKRLRLLLLGMTSSTFETGPYTRVDAPKPAP